MITSLTIRNFQAHKSLAIDVDPHLTTIVGSSDVGKSAIVRALRVVLMNRPGGVSFVRYGAKMARVRLVIDGRVLTRERGRGVNHYLIDKKPLLAFGVEVPEEVANLVGVGDINFQQQHDAPFWFSETAGEVSRKLNGIINLGAIDQVLAAVGKRQRQAALRAEVAEEGLKTARRARKGLVWVEEADQSLAALEAKVGTARQTAANAARLRDLILMGSNAQLDQTEGLKRLRYGRAVLEKAEERQEVRKNAFRLGELIGDGKRYAVWASRRMPEAEVLTGRIEKLLAAKAMRDRLARVVRELRQSTDAAGACRKNATMYETRFEKLMGKRCPLCQQKMK